MDETKDGVTLIAEAIRREQEEEAKKTTPVVQNVSDITAQFTQPTKPTEAKDKDTTNKDTETKTETKTETQEDN